MIRGVEAAASPEPRSVRVLVADRDAICRRAIAASLTEQGHRAVPVATVEEAIEAIRDASEPATAGDDDGCDGPFDAAIVELPPRLPGEARDPAAAAIEEFRRLDRRLAIVAVSGHASIEEAVAAVRAGADDYLVKPLVDLEVSQSIAAAIARRHFAEGGRPAPARRGDSTLPSIVGSDPRMARVHELVRAVSATAATVLMTGESGTGKSLIARAIHRLSPRAAGPFVELACGSIPETLLESELFGHVRGAFTGAIADKRGRFLAAHGGTIFLDEINSASPAMQLKLLRVLQERRFEAVGSDETIEVDVRVILASNQPLEQLVAEGRFRQDLYYRIAVIPLELPPLRERLGDLPALAEAFLARFAEVHRRPVHAFEAAVLERLSQHDFPGNVRELENLVERAVVLAKGHLVTPAELPPHLQAPAGSPAAAGLRLAGSAAAAPHAARIASAVAADADDASALAAPAAATLDEAVAASKRRILQDALDAHGWNRTRAAAALGIDRTTLYKQMRSLGLQERRRAG